MITTSPALDELVARLRSEPRIALDTEFVWMRTYYARLGLVQVAVNDGTCFLIDSMAIPDLTPLGEIIAAPHITKVLHDAPQDLMILRRATGASARGIFDTRLAAGFAGFTSVLSLSNLLLELLNIDLPKEHTRADWTARPLSPQCLAYAADDVRYLLQVEDLLRERARQAGVEAWLIEELSSLDEMAIYEEKVPEDVYRQIRAAASLKPRKLAVLRELGAWREKAARAADKPRRWLAEDRELVAAAQTLPDSTGDLSRCDSITQQTARRHGRDLITAVQQGLSIPEHELPASTPRLDRSATFVARVDAALQHIRDCAERHSLDPQLICNRNDVAVLLQTGADAPPGDHALLRSWRAELLGDGLFTSL